MEASKPRVVGLDMHPDSFAGAILEGHPSKIKIARQLRSETPMSRQWIAQRLTMGSPSYVSALISVDSKL